MGGHPGQPMGGPPMGGHPGQPMGGPPMGGHPGHPGAPGPNPFQGAPGAPGAPNPYGPPVAQGGYGAYGQGGHPMAGKTPGIVIAGFILSFLCSLVGLIMCIIGLKEAKARGAGVGLAYAGIVIGAIFMVLGGINAAMNM